MYSSVVAKKTLCIVDLAFFLEMLVDDAYTMIKYNVSTQRAQISNKAAHYSHIAQIRDLESQDGDPDPPENLFSCY